MSINSKIQAKNNYVTLVLLHIIIGFVIFVFNTASTIYFVFLLFYFTIKILFADSKQKTIEILLACAYFTGFEVLFRMTKGGLSYEASKYLIIIFTGIGIFYGGVKGRSYPYFIYLILLVPAIIVASITLSYDAKFRTNIAFVLSGPVCLGVAALFCYDRKVTRKQLKDILLFLLLPCISTTTYLFLFTPTIKSVLSGTASNFATSGGFGPNQVSTILGLGIFAIIARIYYTSENGFVKLLNLVILAAISYRALVTFSRGGVVAAAIVVIVFLGSLIYRLKKQYANKLIGLSILLVLALIITWFISSNQTKGLIDRRYANETATGVKKNDISTGRLDLFIEEIDGFVSSPFIGIGASRTKNIRVETNGHHLPSHNEIGRLLSEHGLLGVFILIILIFKPLAYRTSNKKNIFFYAFLAFWFATINHSGMRIAAPSFLYALALLNVTNEKTPVYRKQLKQ